MNPLESEQPFSLTLANPNPKFRPRKDGDRWFIEFEVTAEEAAYFLDPNIDRTGMVIEAIHCEVTHQHEKPKDEKPKGGPLAELAGMWSKDERFWEWMTMQQLPPTGGEWRLINNEGAARSAILKVCEIQSRRELDHDARARRVFEEVIRRPYANYLARLGR